jgi:hypothetical protein
MATAQHPSGGNVFSNPGVSGLDPNAPQERRIVITCQLGVSTSFFAITLTAGGSFTGQELGALPCFGGPISGTLSNEALTFTVDPVGLTVVSFEGTRVLAALGGRQ